jgi:hypothetical protein
MFLMCIFQIAGALAAILSATPAFSLAVLPISWIYLSAMNYFRAVTRELKRLEALSKSPVYSHLSETLGGLSVIRAFAREKAFTVASERKVRAPFAACHRRPCALKGFRGLLCIHIMYSHLVQYPPPAYLLPNWSPLRLAACLPYRSPGGQQPPRLLRPQGGGPLAVGAAGAPGVHGGGLHGHPLGRGRLQGKPRGGARGCVCVRVCVRACVCVCVCAFVSVASDASPVCKLTYGGLRPPPPPFLVPLLSAGLAITNALGVTGLLNWAVGQVDAHPHGRASPRIHMEWIHVHRCVCCLDLNKTRRARAAHGPRCGASPRPRRR